MALMLTPHQWLQVKGEEILLHIKTEVKHQKTCFWFLHSKAVLGLGTCTNTIVSHLTSDLIKSLFFEVVFRAPAPHKISPS